MIDLTGIISISGQPGLFKIIAQSKNGIIVEGLLDKKRVNVYASTKVSTLSDISMFTTGEDMPIESIMHNIFTKEKGGIAVDNKADDKTIEAYFASVLPEYDKDRVYVSNMRKLFTWYNTLQTTGNLKEKEEKSTEDSKDEKAKAKVAAENKTKKASASNSNVKTKTSAGVKKTAGVRKTGTA
jgi:hypothetical protein